jgi:large subunit ribosomal protein L18
MYRHIRARRRSSKTNYKKRIALLKSGLPRIIIRKSNRGIIAQLVSYNPKGDIVVSSASSKELEAQGWLPRANIPTAYLTGMLLAKKAKGKYQGNVVLDIGLYKPVKSSVVFAGARGAVDGGMGVINSIEVDQDRISGKHIEDYARSMKEGSVQFSAYGKEKVEVKEIRALFDEVKKKILT